MLIGAQTPEPAGSGSKTAEEPTTYPTSWASEEFPIERKPLEIDVLKNGGLTMVKLPYNEEGAVDRREAINSMSCDYMLQNSLFNPMFLDQVMRAAQSSANPSITVPTKTLHYQHPKSRGGSPNKLFKAAPEWSSLHYLGTCVSGKPKDITASLTYAVGNMPEYDGVKITIIDGESRTIVSQEELEATEIVMLPPPIATPRAKRNLNGNFVGSSQTMQNEIAALKAEIAALKHTALPLPLLPPPPSGN